MRRIVILLFLAAGVVCPAAFAQTAAAAPACPATPTLDSLVKALDAALSGPANGDKTCLRDLFLPDARLWPVFKKQDGSVGVRTLTVDEFISLEATHSGGKVVYEHQIKIIPETYGHIAHLWATYEVRENTLDSKPVVRGINSFYAVNDGARWHFQAIEWEAEKPDTPLPAKYLP